MSEPRTMKDPSRDPLDQFGGDVPMQVRKAALTALLAARAVARSADDPRFNSGRVRLATLAADENAPPADRLLAIAESVRAVQTLKRLQADTTSRLEAAFERPLPRLSLLAESEDRLNVARACRRANAQWLPAYLAQAIADEESGELARGELLNALLERSSSLASALGVLTQAFASLAPTTEKPADSIARRLARTLAPLRDAAVRSSLEAGHDVGDALARLVAASIRGKGYEIDPRVASELAQEALLAVHDIVRTRFSVATEASTFAVVGYLRRMLGGGTWPQAVQAPLQLLVGDVREALLLLGRQGVTDQGLLDQLPVLTNFPERARAIGKELAAAHPELPENVRDWLEHGRVRQRREANATAEETVARDADSFLGFALIAVRALSGTAATLESPLLSTVEVYEPDLAAAVREHFKQAIAAAARVEDAARKRRLSLFGTVGAEIDYTPKFFDAPTGTAGQRVRVRQPAVVRLKPDGTPGEVVVKGIVE